VARWEAGASGRLREAALALYLERGFEQTTVAEIAARAGLTARTFFRHFADKREVLFAGSSDLLAELVRAIDAVPADATPMEAVGVAVGAAGDIIGGDREHSRRRQEVIAANPELQERELIKMASLAGALAAGLRRRGLPEPDASLAAEAGVVAFRVGFETWLAEDEDRGLGRVVRDSLDRLRSLAR
jgi:AcrR family transcriptional regulator